MLATLGTKRVKELSPNFNRHKRGCCNSKQKADYATSQQWLDKN